MRVCLSEITWQAVAAIASLCAVIAALIPILREAQSQKARARSLRIRLYTKLVMFRPALPKIVHGGQAKYAEAILSKEEFVEAVRSVGAMMQKSYVLRPRE